ncbi:Heterogeneous nuclear ribonucleoprotein 1 [Platanthera guangdongensis]|uniref:Heterogeneous nuclear ribonucleoprotein 1 n=1 Tax=Platanthera guangdongensis TaxID=2320717 RepID=A0ABR2MZW6_9ASPA
MDSDHGKLFIGGISWETTEEKLSDYFGKYGDVLQTVVMRDKITGKPRGFGFVIFADLTIVDHVLQDTHTIDGRTICVVSHLRNFGDGMIYKDGLDCPGLPMYPPGNPGIGQQLFYQAPPNLVPPQPRFGYQQRLVPGMRPGGGPMPIFFVPFVQPGQHPRPGSGRRIGPGPMQQTQQPLPLKQREVGSYNP